MESDSVDYEVLNNSALKVTRPLRMLLKTYEQQVLSARQLARFRAKSMKAAGLDMDEPPRGLNRSLKVNSVIEELSLSLMFSGNSFPAIEEIRLELSRQMNKEVEFVYPPGKKLKMYIKESTGLRPLTAEEQEFVNNSLGAITRHKVDEQMANHPGRINNND